MSRWGFVYAEKEQRGGRRTDGNLPLSLRSTQNLGELRRWFLRRLRGGGSRQKRGSGVESEWAIGGGFQRGLKLITGEMSLV
jgi:hypothetical protein